MAACPAGDSILTISRPARIRALVYYSDGNCNAWPGVPPESIWVTTSITSGNLVVNSMAEKIFADDSTNSLGIARITISSFSGCGRVRLNLYVSGVDQGYKDVYVRTTDTDADGRTETADWASSTACDLNYDGSSGGVADIAAVASHADHWHRNALFGTLVRRTNFCGSPPCQGDPGWAGYSQVGWSPSGRWMVLTAQPYGMGCKAFVVASGPADGNVLRRITHASPTDSSDYDPSWSPLGHEITFGRGDNRIYRKGIPGFSADTSTYRVTAHDDGGTLHRGDLNGAISPDGRWVAYSRRTSDGGPFELFKIPINGDSSQTQQLTSHETMTDYYPSWSPDGEYIIFQRGDSDTGFVLIRVRADGSDEEAFYDHDTGKPFGYEATTPAYSPDGRIVLAGIGPTGEADSVVTHTIDTTSAEKIPIKAWNYNSAEFAVPGQFPILTPRLSPDGTRLALATEQLWAARRNMNLPPRITKVGSQNVVDSTARVFINAAYGLETELEIVATDPEDDEIICNASFLQDGMSFDPGSCVLTWTPTLTVGSVVHVKFQVTNNDWPAESGGSDQVLGIFTVTSPSPQASQRPEPRSLELRGGPNPTQSHFSISAPRVPGLGSTLVVRDIAGRVLATVNSPSGTPLVWDGTTRRGEPAAPGIYLYDLSSGSYRRMGKVVVVR